MVLLDVAPLSLGIQVVGGVMHTLIKRNTTIPARKSQVCSTNQDNQTSVNIEIFEGERPMCKDNHALGNFMLNDIPPAQRGVPQIEVTFEIDANGILNVSALDKATSNSENITITNDTGRLSEAEIEKMIRDAELYKEQDEQTRARVEAIQSLRSYIASVKTTLENDDVKNKLEEDEIIEATASISDAEEWLEENQYSEDEVTVEDINEKLTEVKSHVQDIIGKLYAQQSAEE